jgi:hypothetical protein
MKTENRIKLAETIIKNSTRFELNQISYTVEKDEIVIISVNSTQGAYHVNEVEACLYNTGLNMYVSYNKETEKCELHVF